MENAKKYFLFLRTHIILLSWSGCVHDDHTIKQVLKETIVRCKHKLRNCNRRYLIALQFDCDLIAVKRHVCSRTSMRGRTNIYARKQRSKWEAGNITLRKSRKNPPLSKFAFSIHILSSLLEYPNYSNSVFLNESRKSQFISFDALGVEYLVIRCVRRETFT